MAGGDPTIKSVLFDIDGTLITTGGAGAVAWRKAFEELHGVPVNIREVTENGMTDPEVCSVALRSVIERDPEPEELAPLMAKYLQHLPEAVEESKSYEVMPGIEEILDRLVDAGYLLGLTTGNVEAAAHIKLGRANLNRFFSFGGYGSDSKDRAELTARGVERGVIVSGQSLRKDHFISVGDTPRDIVAGHGAGIRVVGVATGNYGLDELQKAGADWAIYSVDGGFPV